jgi:hypothetical protein
MAEAKAPTPDELEWLIIKLRSHVCVMESLLDAIFSSLKNPEDVFREFCKNERIARDLLLDTELTDEELNYSREEFKRLQQRLALILVQLERKKARGKKRETK